MAKIKKVEEPAVAYQTVPYYDTMLLIRQLKSGVKFSNFLALAEDSPFTMSEWSQFLHLSERTMQRYRKENTPLGQPYSEIVLQIAQLFKFGVEVFGNKENFVEWLNSTNLALGKVKPKTLLDSSMGIGLVNDTLGRIQHGIIS